MYIYIYIHLYVCMYVYIHIHIFIYYILSYYTRLNYAFLTIHAAYFSQINISLHYDMISQVMQ